MRTLIKSVFSVAVAGLLMVTLQAGAAESAKDKNEPLEKCKAECLSIKDNTAYEGCMLKCNKTHESVSPAVPMKKK